MMTIVKGRRSLLRWMAVAGAAGPALSLWPKASRAQHHHDMTRQAPAHGDETLIFAAATLKPALDEIVRIYRDAGGAALNVAYGPTPMLAKNIADGAPADIFFSADGRWMDYLSEHKLIRNETRAEIVKNELVLIKGGSEGPAVTVDHNFPIARIVGAGPLAMCNPDSHPAGRYGKASLQELGLWDTIAAKIVIAENPQVAALMVARGDAPAAIVFATDIHGVSGVTIAGTFPDAGHPPITYPAAVATDARHSEEAARFLTYLRSPEARKIFDRFGYQ